MTSKKVMVSDRRNYSVRTTEDAKKIATEYLAASEDAIQGISFGLPEINDRYNTWKVPILFNNQAMGDIIIDALAGVINKSLSSDFAIIKKRISSQRTTEAQPKKTSRKKKTFVVSPLNNKIIRGRSELALRSLPEQSIDLVFTSPPYYNARKQYSEYATYDDYLLLMRKVIRECARVLIDGKFFVINSSHVLVPRNSRNESSSRIAVPFDLHQILLEEGFEFMDDIIWQKPEGAGWASGRGRRFSADRNPMQYKAVPVTEYVMVYRKKPCVLIDHFIRDNPNQDIVLKSKIKDGYEKTNIWYISPARDRRHPAIFPAELAEKVITYYSFINDVVLDPFGGIGTTAKAAKKLGRRFCSIEMSEEYTRCAIEDLQAKNPIGGEAQIDIEDLSGTKGDTEIKSFDHLVHKLIHEGYTKEDLYDILNDATNS